jgi:hypothetical protein
MQHTGRSNPKPCKSKCMWYWTRSQAQEVLRGLNLEAVRPMTVQVTNCSFRVVV